jgi:hypothetical protein
MKPEFLDRPLPGWFVLDVMRWQARKSDWVALMIDFDPDDFRNRNRSPSGSCWVRIPGEHRDWESAWDALEDMMAMRH